MEKPDWLVAMKRFEKIDARRSLRELLNSLLPYLVLFAAMGLALRLGLRLYDKELGRLVGFREARAKLRRNVRPS